MIPSAGDRRRLLSDVSQRLGNRPVVWAGLRADDIEPLTDLPQLDASFSIIGAYQARRSVESLAYEDLTGVRPDLDDWDIDDHLSEPATQRFRQAILSSLARPSALLAYRPSRFLSAIWFARQDQSLSLSLFGAHQAAFEHKPWVETAVASLGIPRIPWRYIADEERQLARRLLDGGPIMLRCNRGSGGAGIVRVDEPDELDAHWPVGPEAFVGVTPFLDSTVPVNVGATVWADTVTVHRPSLQLIGIDGCVTRAFGYCGNDFGAARALSGEAIDQIERSTTAIGGWLRSHGYVGTFGVDFLVHQGVPLFTEVNARFQGSTPASCRLSIEERQPCLVLEHVAAMLRCEPPPYRPLGELVASTRPLASLTVHWTGERPASVDAGSLVEVAARTAPTTQSDVFCRPDVEIERGAVVVRLTADDVMTDDGFRLVPRWRAVVDKWLATRTSVVTGGPDGVAVHK